jgi:CRP/FNR family transcriptional regulator, cyclic AMP receptor protein
MPRKVLATVEQVHDCPIFKVGDRMTASLPELLLDECDAVCVIALSDLLPWTIKLTAGGGSAGSSTDAPLLCRGCRGGKAQAGFHLEAAGDVQRDAQKTRRLVSLKQIPLFAQLPDRQLDKISPMIQDVEYKPGERIITFGEPGRALSIIVKGQVEVLKPDNGQEKLLGILSSGECFGEMSLLTGDPCSATIRAKDHVRALMITKSDFDQLLARNPVLNRYFSKLLALRLNKLSKQFSDETGKAVTGNLTMIGPTELIQAITVTSRTGALRISEGPKFIELFFHEGQIWSISATISDPDEAFYDFMAWDSGQFGFQPAEKPDRERTFHKDTTSLLLEGMRRMDEGVRTQ